MNPQLYRDIRTSIQSGDVTKMSQLLENNDDVLMISTPLGTWLHQAADYGQLDVAKKLISLGLDINARGGPQGSNALNVAAGEGHLEIVEWMLDNGAQMDLSEPERNPLFSSIIGGHLTIAKLLIERGIDTTIKYTGESMKDMDAVAFANEQGRYDIKFLLEKGQSGSAPL